MGRKARKRADNLGKVAILIAIAALVIGFYIDYQLRKYGVLGDMFGAREKGWRDQAFGVGMWSAIAGVGLFMIASVLRRL
jgi:hypothetical protein